VKVFGKDVGLVRKRALRRGYLDEEIDGALVGLNTGGGFDDVR
jgi:hypothetical protein